MATSDSENPRALIAADWLAEFEAAARRPLAQRMRYAFAHHGVRHLFIGKSTDPTGSGRKTQQGGLQPPGT